MPLSAILSAGNEKTATNKRYAHKINETKIINKFLIIYQKPAFLLYYSVVYIIFKKNQMKKEQKVKNTGWLFTFLISVLSVFFVIYLTRNNCFWDDDGHYAILYDLDDPYQILSFNGEHGCGYIGLFLLKMTAFLLPLKLGIHPEDFICGTAHGLIKGFYTLIVIYLFSRFFDLKEKYKLLYPFLYFFTVCYFFYSVFTSETWIYAVNYNFYRYFFSLIFFCYFIYATIENLICKNKKIQYSLLLTMFSGYVIGASSEILYLVAIGFYICIIFWNIICVFLKNQTEKFNINIFFVLSFLSLLVFTCLTVTSFGFQYVAFEAREFGKTVIDLQVLKNFVYYYVLILFKFELAYWLIFLYLIVNCFSIAKKKNELNKIYIPSAFLFTILIVMFSLILCSQNNVHSTIENCYFYTSHRNVRFLYKMLLIIPLFMYLSYFFNNSKEKFKKFCIVILNIFNLYFITVSILFVKNYVGNDYLKDIRKKNYIIEKIYRYNILTNEEKNIDKMCVYDYSQWFYENYDNGTSDLNMYMYGVYTNYTQAERRLYEKSYKYTDNAIKTFYKNGGTFSEKELQELKFQNLLNDDFVLNKK